MRSTDRALTTSFIALLALMPGCTCAKRVSGSDLDSQSAPSAVHIVPPSSASMTETASFATPIAGARLDGYDVLAGFVETEGLIRVIGVSGGRVIWTSDALKDVAHSADAELTLQSTAVGLAIVWRGLHAGKRGRTFVWLGLHGEPKEAPVDVGAAFCATSVGAAWLEPSPSGPTRIVARTWMGPSSSRTVGSVPTDRDAALACGDRDVAVLADGDDDLTAAWLTPGDPSVGKAEIAVRDADFGDDEEREHEAYMIGDTLGLVRVGSSGSVTVRELSKGGVPSAWRRIKHSIPADDDVVAVDADEDAVAVVFAHEVEPGCPRSAAGAEAIRALRVNRRSGEEAVLDLAGPDCNKARGPFWLAATSSGSAIGWVERSEKEGFDIPSVAGASFRILAAGGVQSKHVDQVAYALVDSGCDAHGCSLVALVGGSEGGANVKVLRAVPYP